MLHRSLLFLLLLALTGVGGLPARALAQTPGDQPVVLPGHVPPATQNATKLTRTGQPGSEPSPAVGNQPLAVTLVLNRDDEAGFQTYLAGVTDPGSPSFGHFLSQEQLAAQFGPSQQDYDAVLSELQSQGFTLDHGSANRLTLTVHGSRSLAEQAFHTQIDDYQADGRQFHANSTDPSLPASIAPLVQAISGLSNANQPKPAFALAGAGAAGRSASPGNAPATNPIAIAKAYDFGTLAGAGSGQTIGLVEYDNYNTTELGNWLKGVGLSSSLASQVTEQTVDTGVSEGANDVEVMLDIEAALGMAQGANIVVFDSANASWEDMLNAMVSAKVTAISSSWFNCEAEYLPSDSSELTAIDSIISNAAGSGIPVFEASGDNGAACNNGSAKGTGINVPSDSPHAVAVGGTQLGVTLTGAYQNETYWNGGCSSTCSGGYGSSTWFSAPAWQGLASGAKRSVPDVSADADPSTGIIVYANGCGGGGTCQVGGTSLAAPEWAAGAAVIDQQQGAGKAITNLNQALYTEKSSNGIHPSSGMVSPNNDFTHLGIGSYDVGDLSTTLGGSGGSSGGSAPGAPTNVTAVAGNASATVGWGAASSGSSAITSYVVTPNPATVGAVTVTCSPPGTCATSTPVTGLTNGTPYTFSVYATNTTGNGPSASTTTSVTPTSGSSGNSPMSLSAALSGGSRTGNTVTVFVGGTQCGTGQSVNRNGTFSVSVNCGTAGQAVTFDVNGAEASLKDGTTVCLAYAPGTTEPGTVTITPNQAWNTSCATGSGPTVPGQPAIGTAVAGNGQATVAWTAPSNGGSAILSYTVTTYISGVAQLTTTPAGANATSVAVGSLTNGRAYTFSVYATNSVGNGPQSAQSNSVTPTAPASAPGAPTNVTAVAGNASATVSWGAASSGSSAITSYVVTPNPATVGAVTVTCSPPGTCATSTPVTGLTNGTPYTFSVYATNTTGNGPSASTTTSVTPTGGTGGGSPMTLTAMISGRGRTQDTVTVFVGGTQCGTGQTVGLSTQFSVSVNCGTAGQAITFDINGAEAGLQLGRSTTCLAYAPGTKEPVTVTLYPNQSWSTSCATASVPFGGADARAGVVAADAERVLALG